MIASIAIIVTLKGLCLNESLSVLYHVSVNILDNYIFSLSCVVAATAATAKKKTRSCDADKSSNEPVR
jgi:hypothetical protein